MKNSNDTIGNRTRDLSTCSAVPQTTAPPRATAYGLGNGKIVVRFQQHILLYYTAFRPDLEATRSSKQPKSWPFSSGLKRPRREPDSILSSANYKND